jgi:hypothetical protein
MVRVSAVNKYTSPTDIGALKYTSPTDNGALKYTLFIILYKSALLSVSPDCSTRLLYVRGLKREARRLISYGPVANIYANTETGPGQRRRLLKSKFVVTCL